MKKFFKKKSLTSSASRRTASRPLRRRGPARARRSTADPAPRSRRTPSPPARSAAAAPPGHVAPPRIRHGSAGRRPPEGGRRCGARRGREAAAGEAVDAGEEMKRRRSREWLGKKEKGKGALGSTYGAGSRSNRPCACRFSIGDIFPPP